MNHQIDLQIACPDPLPVSEGCLIDWVNMALHDHEKPVELTLRLVAVDEIRDLNKTYRQQDKSTNVLAFPSQLPEVIELDYPFLGDVIVCPAVLQRESVEQQTPLDAHWAHIVIHGVLHLLGYNHIEEEDAKIMQSLESQMLATLGFANPYQEGYSIE